MEKNQKETEKNPDMSLEPKEIWIGFNEFMQNHGNYRTSIGTWKYNFRYVREDVAKKRSNLTNSDVCAICDMQKKIDAYEEFIILLHAMLQKRDESIKCLLQDTPVDCYMNGIWRRALEIIKKEKE